jgi:glycosyltransferase involved in cell wall biosynthesis
VRLLFYSYHCLVDSSSGAALATRDLLEDLAGGGWQCRALCGPYLDFEQARTPEQVLTDQRLPFLVRYSLADPLPFALIHVQQGVVPVTICSPSVADRTKPTRAELLTFLALLVEAVESFKADVVLTFGDAWLCQEAIAFLKRRHVPIVFALHNADYRDATMLRAADALLVPSHFAQVEYQRRLGVASTTIPSLINWARVRAEKHEHRYVTFVNPQPAKGVFVFARIATELARRRPDIPLLVVEGRGRANWLDHAGLVLRGLANLHVMANTADPRDFYSVSRLVLVPSVCDETFARVAAEAMINGLPVLASRRGALAETLGDAGFLFEVPAHYTPASRLVPTADEIAPWVETIIQLWDDSAYYAAEQRRSLAAAEKWRPEAVRKRYEEFFLSVLR